MLSRVSLFVLLGGLLLMAASYVLAGDVAGATAPPARVRALPPQGGATPTATPCPPSWQIVTSPNQGTSNNYLLDVAVVNSDDVWAVGYYESPNLVTLTLVEHWDGGTWSAVPSPSQPQGSNRLLGVAAVSSTDVWAVGYYLTGSGARPLIEHWNGSAWTIVPSPNQGIYANYLTDITVVNANDIWAAGYYLLAGSFIYQTLTQHWDGSAWTIVPSPNQGTADNHLTGVTAAGSNEAWAVGYYASGTVNRTLALHWDGSAWSVVSTPNQGARPNSLQAVVAVSAGDVWAAGYYDTGSIYQTLIEHWNGSAWTIVASPNVSQVSNFLRGMAATSSNDVWAVGYDYIGVEVTLVLHWDGSAWTIMPSPNPVPRYNYLEGVAAVNSNEVWAVGYYHGSYDQTLIERYADPCIVRITPTVTPTGTATRTATPTPTPTETPPCGPDWRVVTSPNPGSTNVLFDVEALAADDVWAVGYYKVGLNFFTLTMHWDGNQWNLIPSPNQGSTYSAFYQVTAVAANDVWAFGTYENSTSARSLIAHWDGSQWTIVPSPNQGPGFNVLYGATALAANDVWAAGHYSINGRDQTLIEHWDGSAWTIVPSPNQGSNNNNDLSMLAAVAANDIWAVGTYDNGAGTFRTLIEHWDGSTWTIVTSPNPSVTHNELLAVTAVAANDAWAVGTYATGGYYQPLTLHWNGTQWSQVSSPGYGSAINFLYGVTAVATNDVWAVGHYVVGSTLRTVMTHWNGSQWTLVPSPNVSGANNRLRSVAHVAANDIWAVGDYGSTLIAHYSDPCNGATATPTPSATSPPALSPSSTPPPAPTNTPSGQTPTAVASSTPCPIQFSDVTANNPFYPFVRCLACRGIVAGYSDGTFHWGADVTRGQLSKIIANAAGLTNAIPSTQQTFSDVPNTNTFWVFIERLAATGAITGYGCGGPGEPCDPANHPYFRWGAPATRGQISKITATAVGFTEPVPSTQQTFADVPTGNVFWAFIERLAARQIISGYGCGGPGEPCDPANRPYFRWGANATRGQMSKIAAQTFFPGCQTPLR